MARHIRNLTGKNLVVARRPLIKDAGKNGHADAVRESVSDAESVLPWVSTRAVKPTTIAKTARTVRNITDIFERQHQDYFQCKTMILQDIYKEFIWNSI